MTPVTFQCQADLEVSPQTIAAQILEVANWSSFQGYGVLPGVREAVFETRTDAVIGSRIRVVNTDGSTHVEEITVWDPEYRLALRMADFSRPLSGLATHFDELWEFERGATATRVTRTFALHPRSYIGKVALWAISFLLRKAINRQLEHMGSLADPEFAETRWSNSSRRADSNSPQENGSLT